MFETDVSWLMTGPVSLISETKATITHQLPIADLVWGPAGTNVVQEVTIGYMEYGYCTWTCDQLQGYLVLAGGLKSHAFDGTSVTMLLTLLGQLLIERV
jgi:hypothetical protein